MKDPRVTKFTKLARSLPVDDRVPFAFEKRIMHAIKQGAGQDVWAMTARIFYRAAFLCVLVTICAGAWASARSDSNSEMFAIDLEETVLAPIHADVEYW